MEEAKVVLEVDTQQAEQNLDKVEKKLDRIEGKAQDVQTAAQRGVTAVGDWGRAFESTFNSVGNSLSQTGAGVRDTVGQIRNAIPLVKNLNSTALSGLGKVRAAIASTGIGALVVAIGLLITHWEGFKQAVGLSTEKIEEFKEKALNALQNVVQAIVGVGNVILQYILTPIRSAVEAFTGLSTIVRDIFTGDWDKVKEDATRTAKRIGEAFRKGFNISENYKAGKEAGEKFIQGVVTTFTYKAPELEKTAKETGSKAGKAFNKGLDQEIHKFIEELTKAEKDAVALIDNLVAKEKLAEQIEGARGLLLKIKDIPEEVAQSGAEALAKLNTTFQKESSVLSTAISKTKELMEKIKTDPVYQGSLEAVGVSVEEALQKEEENLKNLYDAQKKLATNHTKDLLGIYDQVYKGIVENQKKSLTEEEEDLKQSYENRKSIIEIEVDWAIEKNAKLYDLEQERLEKHKEYLENLLNLTQEGTDEYTRILKQIEQTDVEITENKARMEENTREQIRETIQTYAEMASSVGDLLGSVADIEKQNLDQKVKNGQISEAQAKKEFERIKGLQIAQTWINTLAGSVGAFLQASSAYPPPYGQIIGGVTAATVLASGIAQTAQIKATQYGSGGSGGGAATSTPSVGNYITTEPEPYIDTSAVQTAQAVSAGTTDQRVYIVESDIQDSNRRVEIRESETTW